MKAQTLLRHLVIRVCMFSGSVAHLPSVAQDAVDEDRLAEAAASLHLPGDRDADVRYDLVDDHYLPCTYNGAALRRELRPLAEGGLAVRVVDADGTLRMTGRYSPDHTPDGAFEYYHDDGSLESRGLFVNGLKWGAWERRAADGTRLPDRIYATLSADELAIALGLANEVCTQHP